MLPELSLSCIKEPRLNQSDIRKNSKSEAKTTNSKYQERSKDFYNQEQFEVDNKKVWILSQLINLQSSYLQDGVPQGFRW